MKYTLDVWTWVIGVTGSLISFISGHIDQSIQILSFIMILDIVTGLWKGIMKRRLRSTVMSLGIMKKGAIILSVVFAYTLDMLVNDGQPVFRTMMVWLAIGNESLSIVENLSAMGVSIPKAITDRLAQITKDLSEIQREKDEPNNKNEKLDK